MYKWLMLWDPYNEWFYIHHSYIKVTLKNHFLQLLLSQARNNIFQVFQSLKSSTHHVQVTDAIGTLQYGILCPPELHKKPLFAIAYISG